MTRLVAILAAVVAIALVGGTYLFTRSGDDDQFAQCRGSAVAGGAGQIGGPFELLNSKGETVTDTDVITEPSLVYFGYTFCPDVCPFDVARNADAIDILQDKGISTTGVFISVDPQRDTPEVVGEYADAMHEKMIGLTGSPEQIKAASQAYKTYYKAHPSDDDLYLVDHSTFTYLVLPEVGFVDFFRREVTPEQMAERVQCFVDRS
ncbi:SCO family protein [Sulfitobacter pseudonitzschiae]|uniref:SCO family protein n=1 Tax=Pseudosulfitobacter pseudonitzschiae TaxID=1402135 RepID=A0A9Q2NGV8_9RHOB|nr:SCO family protein [Pseudosulfitobacter pseudonitzschiae]MBM2290590.1 SCO family protein [Pseudosulfitobacter pseudonitzschiae]MBM2295508.1 SCO family protein [Pseudosulfitobacter pseudonitzschiae]MBM2300420.1 SCO family protein [Pseudosulfitobacter pseudonitzschiae]MBM2310205.1 SCO family protein [Pseudosulfitobacter pseudonitzschiae]MBM2315117.1 SCO family protein [Pseudosulfitobacter pseudonitzschiae]|tara:strand:+ start:327037 stop:327654 length:618 start_codon:yes stop_codon:yes gene_type:complete